MTTYLVNDEVLVFMADVQHLVRGLVTEVVPGRVLVSLNDRMCPVAVDPANHYAIQPFPGAMTA